MGRVLLYVPTYANAMLVQCKTSIEAQEYNGELVIQYGRHNKGKNKRERLLSNQRNARRQTLEGDYDALLLVEHDMQIPPTTVQMLDNTDAPVVYGVYLFRHKTYTLNAFRYDNDRNIGMTLANYPQELEAARRRGQVRVSGTGLGCTLIRRSVLEQFDFRVTDDDPYADLVLSRDCLHAGILQVARLDVPCLHYCPDDDRWLNPEGRTMATTKVTALQKVNVAPDGVMIQMVAGEQYDVPAAAVDDLVRAGFVQVVEAPKPKRTPRKRKVSKAN
jgi:hypothetical protein